MRCLATFGVPDTGRRDATDALACARGMLAALAAWNREREAAGLRPLRMGLGLHYGPVVAGDIGSRRSMAFATVGDTTNVTSRLQALTRELRVSIVASGALVAAVEREAADLALLQGLTTPGSQRATRARHADRAVGGVATAGAPPLGLGEAVLRVCQDMRAGRAPCSSRTTPATDRRTRGFSSRPPSDR